MAFERSNADPGWSIFLAGGSLGLGSTRLGGGASTVEGWKFAFGRLEELRTTTFGHEARDADNPKPLDRLTGVGRISRKTGAYSDGISKGHGAHLLVSEQSGACDPTVTRLLHSRLAPPARRRTRRPLRGPTTDLSDSDDPHSADAPPPPPPPSKVAT